MELDDSQLERYARHIVLKDVGGPGQQRFLSANILIIGAGGIGSPAALYLAAAGIGELGIVDNDAVSLSNLQRQVLHTTADIGTPKTDSAARHLSALNPDVTVRAHAQRLDGENARELVSGYDLVLDGADTFSTRLAVNAACVAERVPLVSAALGPFDGQLSVFKGYDGELPCYQCFVPQVPPNEAEQTCEQIGILGAVAGVLGAWAALEALREIAGIGESLAGRMLLFDGIESATRTVRLKKDPECPVCAG